MKRYTHVSLRSSLIRAAQLTTILMAAAVVQVVAQTRVPTRIDPRPVNFEQLFRVTGRVIPEFQQRIGNGREVWFGSAREFRLNGWPSVAPGRSIFAPTDSSDGYISTNNPWNTSHSAFFPNGITTAGSTNWIYGSTTYIGTAPSNGFGHQFNASLGSSHVYLAIGGGNVGIGTTTPAGVLDVAMSDGTFSMFRGKSSAPTTGTGLLLYGRDPASAPAGQPLFWHFGVRYDGGGGSWPAGALGVYDIISNGAGGSAGIKNFVFFDPAGHTIFHPSTGNVGIGTTSPNYKLDVNGTTQAATFRLANGFEMQQGAANYGQFNSWVHLNGYHGFYSSLNNAHIYPNDASYGAWRIQGTRGGYGGINYNGKSVLMMQDDLIGLYNEPYGRWTLYGIGSTGNTIISPNGGNVGIGMTDPGVYKLNVNGEVNATGLRINGTPISSGGSSQWTDGSGSISYNGGNVGIGTTTPAVKLAVQNSASFTGTNGIAGSNATADLYNNTAAAIGEGAMLTFSSNYSQGKTTRAAIKGGSEQVSWDASGYLAFYVNRPPQVNTLDEMMRITTAGNVGIGTTTPLFKLHVDPGSSATGRIRLGGDGSATHLGFNLALDTATGKLNFEEGSGGGVRMTIQQDGNVGIGTINPSARLTVAGSGVDNGSTGIDFTNTNGNTFRLAAGVPGVTNSNFSISQGGTAELVIANGSGNVGISKMPDASYKLDVNGEINATGLRINGTPISSGGGSSQWANGSGSISYSDGNVGIGTANPGTKLQVNGDILTNGGEVRLAQTQNETATRLLSYSNANSLWMLQPTTQRFVLADGLNWDRGVNFEYTAGTTGAQAGQLSIGQLSKNSPNFTHGTTTFYTNGAERLRINSQGNVGIGTTSPSRKLEVVSDTTDPFFFNGTYNKFKADLGWTYLESYHGAEIVIDSSGSYDDRTFTISKRASRIGGGTPTPIFTVSENGNVNITGSINAKYQDVAEWVASSEQLAAGTVVVLDSTKSNQVISSSQSYDTRVAGVISLQPGIALGEKSDSKVLVATTGRVKVKVDASKGPIHIGDLLVTSDVPGVAMKSEAVNLGGVQLHRPGTLIGKALEPLEKGKGEILVLLSLQ